MDVQKLFAERIGGEQFGKVKKVFKFTLINNAKQAFIEKNPDVKVIDMGVGEPEELPSAGIMTALDDAARVKANRIYPCNGILEFQEAAARYLQREFGIAVDPKTEVMHCIGAKTALAQIPLAFVNPGDTVVATTPGYPVLPQAAEWLGAEVVSLPLEARHGFMPDGAQLAETIKEKEPKIVLLNYPNNPTGALATRNFLERVISLAHEHEFIIVQDAAYADYVYDGDFISPLQLDGGKDVTLELYSLSKGFNMQGYRIGFVAGGAPLVQAFSHVKDNTDNGQFIAIQKAAIHALDSEMDFLRHNKEKYLRRMQRVSTIFSQAGIEVEPSPSTFYLYLRVPDEYDGVRLSNAQDMADLLISRYGIVTVPWDNAGAYLRLSMTFEVGNDDFPSEDSVLEALSERLLQTPRA